MPYKVCPFCNEISYSATENPKYSWLCPHCQRDIDHVESKKSIDNEENKYINN